MCVKFNGCLLNKIILVYYKIFLGKISGFKHVHFPKGWVRVKIPTYSEYSE